MEYGHVIPASFRERPNRFIAMAEADGQLLRCHVKNTGRCRELLVPGATIYLEKTENPKRSTQWDVIAVQKGQRLINMDSQAPNKLAAEYLPGILPGLQSLKAEHTWGDSRFDFLAELEDGSMLIEVKGVTLEKDGRVFFPDAPTERGVKHVRGLMRAKAEGFRAMLLFVVQMADVSCMLPNRETHSEFAEALEEAASAGVELRAITCTVTPNTMTARKEIPVLVSEETRV